MESKKLVLLFFFCSLYSACATPPARHEARTIAQADNKRILYYYASARIYNMKTGATSSENVLLVKTIDPAQSSISEIACVGSASRPAYISPVYMKIVPDGSGYKIAAMSELADFSGTRLKGTGTLSGPSWDWTYLTFSMDSNFCPSTHPCPAHVNDGNFVVHGTGVDGHSVDQLIGRKQIFAADGSPFELYDLEMNLITVDQYNTYFKQMGCPSNN